MGFSQFHGNRATVTRLREMLARDRFPQAVILSGPEGSGKFTLTQMIAKAANCLDPYTDEEGLPDFCGACANCTRIGEADDLETRFAEAVEAREGLRETDKKETRILIQSHPDVMIIPPDPPQLLVKVDQVRKVTETIYYRPSDARRRFYIFSDSRFMKEAANALLKVLEEPPDFASLFLLTTNPGELLPTIRSRCISLQLAPLPQEEVEAYLSKHRKDWQPKQRALVARLSGGAIGRAKNFDVQAYMGSRNDALLLLSGAVHAGDHSALFKATETYRAGADGKEKTEALIRSCCALLEDLLFLKSGTPELVRNSDLQTELNGLAKQVDFDWINRASQGLAEVERGMRRNLLRNLSLDAFAVGLER